MAPRQAKTASSNGETQSDFEVFDVESYEITTNSGDKIKIPRLSFRKERLISKIIGNAVGVLIQARDAFLVDDDSAEEAALNLLKAEALDKILTLVFTTVPEQISSAMSIVLSTPDKEVSVDWVEDNLVSEEMLKFLVPFLVSRKNALEKVLKPYGASLQAVASTMTMQ